MREANSPSFTESASGGVTYDGAQNLCDSNIVQRRNNEMPTRINTWQLNVKRNNINRSISNNNDSTNQTRKENGDELIVMNKDGDWESNVGQLTGEVNDEKAYSFTCGEWKHILT